MKTNNPTYKHIAVIYNKVVKAALGEAEKISVFLKERDIKVAMVALDEWQTDEKLNSQGSGDFVLEKVSETSVLRINAADQLILIPAQC